VTAGRRPAAPAERRLRGAANRTSATLADGSAADPIEHCRMRKLGTVIGEMSNIAYRSPVDKGPLRSAGRAPWLDRTVLSATLALGLCCAAAGVRAESATSGWRQTISPPPVTHAQGERKRASAQRNTKASSGVKPRSTRVEPQSKPVTGAGLGPPKVTRSTLGPIMAEPTGANAAYIAYDQSQYLTALRIAKYHAERNDAAALTLLGRIYENGLGVPRDELTAAKLYRRAAQLGDTEGLFSFAVMLAAGRGIEKNTEGAAGLFEKAARTGHPEANYNLGLLFISGIGKPENPRRAAMHIRYAAEQGLAAAQYDLAALYRKGHGIEPDAYLATTWLRRAADAGMPSAQFEYAIALLQGRGFNADRPRVLEYLLAAARHGIAGAQNRLAHIYFEGSIVRRDMVEATKWRLVAKAAGLPVQPHDAALDKAISQLPDKALAAARRRADEFIDGARIGAPS
jgi:TPR repeat protein